ncbi:hypothetical protein [Streptomyces sp. NPDC058542]|uniref:hypothetical protein n=1 Tax=Streptomyces sp. NPDC058542 TaxID=3346543 RepID=UPI003654070A
MGAVSGMVPPVRRVVPAIRSFVVELLGETVLEMLLTVVGLCVVAALAAAFIWSRQRSPVLAGGVGGAVVLFLGYGAWESLRTARPGRNRRPAGAASLTFFVAVVIGFYAWQ